MSNDVDEPGPDGGATSNTMEEQSREATDSDETVPQVDLTLRDLSVSVTGGPTTTSKRSSSQRSR